MAHYPLNHHNDRENDVLYSLGRSYMNNFLIFKGRHDPDGAHTWLKGIEKIFGVMACSEEQKVHFGTRMLKEEAKDWWDNAC